MVIPKDKIDYNIISVVNGTDPAQNHTTIIDFTEEDSRRYSPERWILDLLKVGWKYLIKKNSEFIKFYKIVRYFKIYFVLEEIKNAV